ncbi:TPA: hypothetical protein N0F65_011000 [Lagenidium giganteum]|uniref:Fibronectin type-III domain-containing protein n=1 Tax=Lagenidium giganteum TaxID=4803 RepID=A0AAV2Z6C8_9STRA|nr:TPA: hypothetical protein N0F65_011000 [Lagenidium giganteum]
MSFLTDLNDHWHFSWLNEEHVVTQVTLNYPKNAIDFIVAAVLEREDSVPFRVPFIAPPLKKLKVDDFSPMQSDGANEMIERYELMADALEPAMVYAQHLVQSMPVHDRQVRIRTLELEQLLAVVTSTHGQPAQAFSVEAIQERWNTHGLSYSIGDFAQGIRSLFAVEEASSASSPAKLKVTEEPTQEPTATAADSAVTEDTVRAVADELVDAGEVTKDVMQLARTAIQAPIIVAAPSCNNGIVLRWKSFVDVLWPVDRFILQRSADSSNNTKQQWVTIVDTNVTDVVDQHVEAARLYTYRVQTISGDTSSPFSYFTVLSGAATCKAPPQSWSILPSLVSEWCPSWNHVSFEAAQTFLLLCTCFFTVYSVMRSSVTRVQCTQSRHSRLQRIRSATALASPAPLSGVHSVRSLRSTQSTQSSTDSSSVSTLSLDSSARSRAPVPRPTQSPTLTRASTSPAVATSLDRAETCHGCRKKFGIFRRRRICEICRAVALCRKCGFQAPVEQSSERDLLQARRNERASSFSNRVERRLVCRDCCTSGVRFSTVPSVRPSIATASGRTAPASL